MQHPRSSEFSALLTAGNAPAPAVRSPEFRPERIIFHVGYPKTASTWLQSRVFPHHPDIDFWKIRNGDCFIELLMAHDLDFDPEAHRNRYFGNDKKKTTRPLLASWEGILSSPYTGGRDICRSASRLRSVFQDAGIIIVLRNQLSMIESLYKHYVSTGGWAGFETFLSFDRENGWWLGLDYFRYDRVVHYYQQLFGKDAVHVCLFEELREFPEPFLKNLADFMGVSPFEMDMKARRKKDNVAFSSISLSSARLINRFLGSTYNPAPLIPIWLVNAFMTGTFLRKADKALLSRLFPSPGILDDETSRAVSLYFAEGNRALSGELGLPMENYGYPL
jgi:hypothetical protein